MKPLFISTGNAGKLKEIRELAIEYLPPFVSITGRAAQSADETGKNFLENASIKSHALMAELFREMPNTELWVISDDSGLSVDALGGDPGLYSARYAGDHVPPEHHMQKLLKELASKNLPLHQRTARYHCALSLIRRKPDGEATEWRAEGRCEGLIAFEAKGASGFGYDPIFYYPDFGTTLSEVPFEKKNSISHRRRAFEALRQLIEQNSDGARIL